MRRRLGLADQTVSPVDRLLSPDRPVVQPFVPMLVDPASLADHLATRHAVPFLRLTCLTGRLAAPPVDPFDRLVGLLDLEAVAPLGRLAPVPVHLPQLAAEPTFRVVRPVGQQPYLVALVIARDPPVVALVVPSVVGC